MQAHHGSGDADAGRRLIRLGPQPAVAVEVNDPAAIGGPSTELEQQGHALGGGGEPHDGARVTASARCGELDAEETPPAALAGGLDLEGFCAGGEIAGRVPGGQDHAAAAGVAVLPLLPRAARPVIARVPFGLCGLIASRSSTSRTAITYLGAWLQPDRGGELRGFAVDVSKNVCRVAGFRQEKPLSGEAGASFPPGLMTVASLDACPGMRRPAASFLPERTGHWGRGGCV